jgi:hypothetical protein
MPSQDGLPPARARAKKLRVVGGQAVLGVSGHDGLAQEMALSLEHCLAEPDRRDSTEAVFRAKIRDALAAPVQRTVAIHRTLQGLPGFGSTTREYVLSHSAVAIPFGKSLRLYVLDPECSLTEVTDELSCATAGAAQEVAEPFLAFLRKLLWPEGPPSLARGELAAYWTVRHAIESNAPGLAHPIQLMVIRRGPDGSTEILERGEREVAVLGQAVESRIEAMKESLRGRLAGSPDGASGRATDVDKLPRKRVPEVRLTLDSPERRRRNWRW